MRNTGSTGGNRKWLIVIGALLGIALLTEILLLTGIFRKGNKDSKKGDGKEPTKAVERPTDVPGPTDEPKPTESPDDLVTVWRVKSIDYERENYSFRGYSYEYDVYGNMTLLLWMNEEGSVDQKREFRYDEANRPVWSQSTSTAAHGSNFTEENTYDERGRLIAKRSISGDVEYGTLYEYDDNDRLTAETETYGNPAASTYRIEYTYNDAGKQVLLCWYNNAGVMDTRIEMEYDDRGNLVRETTYSEPAHTVSGMHTLKYDSENRVIEDAHYLDAGDTLLYITWNEYDANGNLIRRSINSRPEISAARTERNEYTYDEHNRMIRERDYYFEDGEEHLRVDVENEYDANGMVIKVTHRNPDGTVSGYDYYEYVSFAVPYENLTEQEKEWYEREFGR